MRTITGFIDFRRLAAGLIVLALIGLPTYFFALRRESDPGIRAAILLTPASRFDQGLSIGLHTGNLAPNFEISTPDGRRVRLEELRGRPVLINFWARWCTSCLSEMPAIKSVQEKLGADAFSVLAINAGETRAEAMQFIDFLKAPFVWALDGDLVVADAYGVYGLPDSFFIDSAGVVQAVYRGHAQRDTLETFIQAAINARPADEPPASLRFITAIPREHLLDVQDGGPGRLTFASRSLRCDWSYCADPAVGELSRLPGVLAVKLEQSGDSPRLIVDFDASVLGKDELKQVLISSLAANPDPLYDQPIQITEPSKQDPRRQ